jgi:hypothetical protein
LLRVFQLRRNGKKPPAEQPTTEARAGASELAEATPRKKSDSET